MNYDKLNNYKTVLIALLRRDVSCMYQRFLFSQNKRMFGKDYIIYDNPLWNVEIYIHLQAFNMNSLKDSTKSTYKKHRGSRKAYE